METVNSYTSSQLTLEVHEDEKTITVIWKGKSTDREPGSFIAPILSEAFGHCEKKGKAFVIDMTVLDYMNSSSIAPLSRILDKSSGTRVAITLVYDAGRKWQEMNFSAMRIFEKKNTNISIQGR